MDLEFAPSYLAAVTCVATGVNKNGSSTPGIALTFGKDPYVSAFG